MFPGPGATGPKALFPVRRHEYYRWHLVDGSHVTDFALVPECHLKSGTGVTFLYQPVVEIETELCVQLFYQTPVILMWMHITCAE